MLGLDPEGPIPLDVLCLLGAPTVQDIVDQWTQHGYPTPISGDPHFRRRIEWRCRLWITSSAACSPPAPSSC